MTGRRLKVLHVVRQYHPSVGGLEAYVHELASRQAKTCDVDILTLNRVFGDVGRLPAREKIDGISVVRIPFLGYRQLFLPFLEPSLLRGYDAIHIHCADQLLDWIALIGRFRNLNLFMTTHGLFFHTESMAMLKRLYLRTVTKMSLGRMRGIFAVSANDARTLENVGVDSIVLLNPIVPLGDFICEGRDLLYVGRLSANKRVELLIPFLAELLGEFPDLKLHIVGSDQEKLWPQISQSIDREGLADHIRFHGYLEAEDLRSIARTCGFTVSASRYEGFGLTVIEGMSIGLLPVMHCNDAFRETFERSQCGLLTSFDDPVQAARAFAAWQATVTRKERERAHRFAHRQSWDAVASTYLDHYEAVASPRS
jgi:alpha-1,3-mannosyltransferase